MGTIINILMIDSFKGNLVCGLCFAITLGMAVYGSTTKRYRFPSTVIICLDLIFEYPALYFFLGASAMPFMIMGMITVLAFSEKGRRVKLCTAAALYDILIMCLRYGCLDYLPNYPSSAYFAAALTSFTFSALTAFLYLYLFITRLEKENDDLKKITEELTIANRTDPMTGLFNRFYLTEYCTELIAEGKDFCAAMIDLDDCAMINDEYGVAYTDMIITEFAGIVNNAVGDAGITARYAGQKFMVIYLGSTGRLEDLLDNVRKEYSAYSMNEKQREFTFSSGISEYEKGMEPSKLYSLAEEKLRRAKRKGKNRIYSA